MNIKSQVFALAAVAFLAGSLPNPSLAVEGGDIQSPEVILTPSPFGLPTPLLEFVNPGSNVQSATIPFVDEAGRYFELHANFTSRAYVVKNAVGQTVRSGTMSEDQRDFIRDFVSNDEDGALDCSGAGECAGELIGWLIRLIEDVARGDAEYQCAAAYREALTNYANDAASCAALGARTGGTVVWVGIEPPRRLGCSATQGVGYCISRDNM